MILDFIGLYLLLAGFIIGLGAVIVIDFHGLLGRKSSYWTEATTRTHKITKPLIWLGVVCAIIGGTIFFRNASFAGVPLYLTSIALVLLVNGLFLSFRVSPYLLKREQEGRASELLPEAWQRKILVSLLFSDVGWWTALGLLVWYLLRI